MLLHQSVHQLTSTCPNTTCSPRLRVNTALAASIWRGAVVDRGHSYGPADSSTGQSNKARGSQRKRGHAARTQPRTNLQLSACETDQEQSLTGRRRVSLYNLFPAPLCERDTLICRTPVGHRYDAACPPDLGVAGGGEDRRHQHHARHVGEEVAQRLPPAAQPGCSSVVLARQIIPNNQQQRQIQTADRAAHARVHVPPSGAAGPADSQEGPWHAPTCQTPPRARARLARWAGALELAGRG